MHVTKRNWQRMRAGGVESGRGGGALVASLLCCGRCGRRLHVVYAGRTPRPVYRCDNPNLLLGKEGCLAFGGRRSEDILTGAVLDVLAPHAITAAAEARTMVKQTMEDKRAVLEMELSQARYDATLAERRYAACDPDKVLIASEIEKRWEEAHSRVAAFEERMNIEVHAFPDVDIK